MSRLVKKRSMRRAMHVPQLYWCALLVFLTVLSVLLQVSWYKLLCYRIYFKFFCLVKNLSGKEQQFCLKWENFKTIIVSAHFMDFWLSHNTGCKTETCKFTFLIIFYSSGISILNSASAISALVLAMLMNYMINILSVAHCCVHVQYHKCT